MRAELDNVIPVKKNINKITRSSVLITDMYYSESFIRKLLYSAGINFELPIIQTSSGKSRGYVWQQMTKKGIQCHHIGDSIHSDVKMPRQFGMQSTHSNICTPNILEVRLAENNLYKLACSFREARLQHSEASENSLIESCFLQETINIPLMLYLSALIIKRFCFEHGKTKLAFASRDCRLLHHATRSLLSKLDSNKNLAETRYWLTSRQARVYGSTDYLQYCDIIGKEGNGLFIDLCGTGASMHILCDRLNHYYNTSHTYSSKDFFIGQMISTNSAENELKRRYSNEASKFNETTVDRHGVIQSAVSTDKTIDNHYLEMINYTPEGMLRDVIKIGDSFIPKRDQCDLDCFQEKLSGFTQNYSTKIITAIINSYSGSTEDLLKNLASNEFGRVAFHMCKENESVLRRFAEKHFASSHQSNEIFLDYQNSSIKFRQ
jgi:hypothetical protein